MTLTISSAFDGGNIRVTAARPDGFDLEIAADAGSDFYQWFYFRLTGAAEQPVTLRITNCAGSAYPNGWPDYRACMSADRDEWLRVPTTYEDGVLTIRVTPPTDSVWFAYFAPYTMERHHDLIASVAVLEGVQYRSLGKSLDGADIDYLQIGDGPLQCWLYGRQHPGEPMAEWWMEGVLEKLTDDTDPVSRRLRDRFTFHIVPNMNPDGTRRGHLRTNAIGVNLNREWHDPTTERSPEVLCVRDLMDETGVDFAIDVHGDEAIPYNFLAGFEGIPSLRDEQQRLYTLYADTLARVTPDFQTRHGYGVVPRGQANLSMSTTQLAERFNCVSMTLEMPFKDNADLPDEDYGWSSDRSRLLGLACLDALHMIADQLPVKG